MTSSPAGPSAPPTLGQTDADRFWDKVDVAGPGDCWPWTAARTSAGYGAFHLDGRIESAHVVALWLDGRSRPDGMHVDHECRNRPCCNPAHLRVVTPADNSYNTDIGNAGRTHCRRGHPFDDTNTYIVPGTGARSCRTCKRVSNRAARRRRRGQ